MQTANITLTSRLLLKCQPYHPISLSKPHPPSSLTMSSKNSSVLLLLLMSLAVSGMAAHSPAPVAAPAGLDCMTALLNMTACLTYVEEGSNLTRPEKGCCPGLAGILESAPVCICQLLANSDAFGIKIDTTKSLMLPTACHLQTPPVYQCSAVGVPVASPAPAAAGGGVPNIPSSSKSPEASTPAPSTSASNDDGWSFSATAVSTFLIGMICSTGLLI